MRKHSRTILMLVFTFCFSFSALPMATLSSASASASAPEALSIHTPLPTPISYTPQPTATPSYARFAQSKLSDHFKVWYDDTYHINPLPIALKYSHEGGIYADGLLHFMPLEEFIEHVYTPPVVIVTSAPVFQINNDAWFYDDFNYTVTYYKYTENNLVFINSDDGNPVELESLSPGSYLMEIKIHATKGAEYYSGSGFIHVIIPGEEQYSEK